MDRATKTIKIHRDTLQQGDGQNLEPTNGGRHKQKRASSRGQEAKLYGCTRCAFHKEYKEYKTQLTN